MIFPEINIRILITLLVLVCATAVTLAQPDYKYKFISRVVANDSVSTPIKGCHIINKTQHMGTVSDEFGNYTITANRKDSLEFSAIGYEKLIIAVQDSMYTNNRIVRLEPKIYELGEVDIGLFSTYDRFKRDVMNSQTENIDASIGPISKFEVYVPPLPNQGGINVPGLGSPVTFLYNLLSKEGKQQRYYLSIVNQTADHVVVGEKFNGILVGRLTGLKDDELVKFMSYCMFTKNYLLQASQVEINRMIMRKYKEYMALKENEEKK